MQSNHHVIPAPGFRKALLGWYSKNKRPLPFRIHKNPFRVWLSEVMAQQTTMTAVIPYFEKFTKHYDNPTAVAKADPEHLLTLWQGLGYYSRIRNFQKACQVVMDDFDGKVPETFNELKSLPGVGDYTAAAVSSICFDQKHAVIDGNVKRVLARLYYFDKVIQGKEADTFFAEKSSELLAPRHPGDFNQAMMELGATVCRPKRPMCLICPVQKFCVGKDKDPEKLPLKKKMNFVEHEYHSVVVTKDDQILLRKPSDDNLIKNMWELPGVYEPDIRWKTKLEKELGLKLGKNLEHLGQVKHGIMNRKITNQIYKLKTGASAGTRYEFKRLKELNQIPLSTLSKKALKSMNKA